MNRVFISRQAPAQTVFFKSHIKGCVLKGFIKEILQGRPLKSIYKNPRNHFHIKENTKRDGERENKIRQKI